jgi:hypothetical protein
MKEPTLYFFLPVLLMLLAGYCRYLWRCRQDRRLFGQALGMARPVLDDILASPLKDRVRANISYLLTEEPLLRYAGVRALGQLPTLTWPARMNPYRMGPLLTGLSRSDKEAIRLELAYCEFVKAYGQYGHAYATLANEAWWGSSEIGRLELSAKHLDVTANYLHELVQRGRPK